MSCLGICLERLREIFIPVWTEGLNVENCILRKESFNSLDRKVIKNNLEQ
jgi:hypothetical protein